MTETKTSNPISKTILAKIVHPTIIAAFIAGIIGAFGAIMAGIAPIILERMLSVPNADADKVISIIENVEKTLVEVSSKNPKNEELVAALAGLQSETQQAKMLTEQQRARISGLEAWITHCMSLNGRTLEDAFGYFQSHRDCP